MAPVIERPRTEAELVAVIKQAAEAGRPVTLSRPSGEGVGIDLSHYFRLVHVDRDKGEATAEAGIPLHMLTTLLGSWGFSLENGPDDANQALGVAVSLGAHGTGAAYRGLASQVTALRLVTPAGTVVACSPVEEPDLFATARVGLGALGVISTVTMRCQPGFNLRVITEHVDLDRALAEFDRLADGNDHFELSWPAGGRRAQVTTANRTDEAADGDTIDRNYRWFNRRRRPRHQVEVSVARAESGPALQRARQQAGPGRLRAPFPIVVTVTAGDDIPLSPAQGRPSVYIAGVADLDGRPQWGTPPGPSVESLRGRYPRFAEWEAVRDRLDPQGRFAQSSGQG